MEVQSIQPTPNPHAYKFLVDRPLVSSGTTHYDNVDQARDNALATALFAVPGVLSLFFAANFVTVTTDEGVEFTGVMEQVKTILEGHEVPVDEPQPEAAGAAAPAPGAVTAAVDDEGLFERINALLDDRVRPALAGDGGGLQIVALDNKALSIRYQGACGTCPSAIQGTLRAIENLLQSEVDEELTVLPA